MREAAIAPPRTPSRGRRVKTSASAKRTRRETSAINSWRILRRHPGKALAGASCVILAVCIVGNAIFFQSGRHPAPLFGSAGPTRQLNETPVATIPLPVPAPRAVVAPSSAPQPEMPAPRTIDDALAAPAAKVATGGPSPIRPLNSTKAATRRSDPIGQLLRDGDKPPEADPRIATAQRSLAKLGFPVKPDGRMGNSTRQAIEKFERDHHLPGSGGVSPKLLRELTAAAGEPPG